MIDVHSHYCSPALPGAHASGPAGIDELDRREAWMRERGIELQLLGPELTYAAARVPPAEEVRRARALNDAAAEDVRGRPAFAPLALLPLCSGAEAADELERAVRELDFRGAMVPSHGLGGLDALWERADALRVPVVVHSGPPAPDPRLGAHGLEAQVGRPHEVAVAALELAFGGVLDRFPALRLVLAMGGGTLLSLAPRLDRLHDGAATRWLRRFHYDALVLEPRRLALLVELVGADRVMVGTDWPFPVRDDDPGTTVRRAGLGSADEERILRGNALALFAEPT